MKEECLICKAPLVYLDTDEKMECAICHKSSLSKARCTSGHYVCDECHSKGVDSVIAVCLSQTAKNPYAIFHHLTELPFCHMHGPEHHVMVGSALLTAYKNAGGDIDLEKALIEMCNRGKQVPGGICGFWGTCGAGVSSGIFVSILTKATPLSSKEWGLANLMTSRSLRRIGEIGGPRCCKRNSYIAMDEAVKFAAESFHIHMEMSPILCDYFEKNNQCLGKKCPFREKN